MDRLQALALVPKAGEFKPGAARPGGVPGGYKREIEGGK